MPQQFTRPQNMTSQFSHNISLRIVEQAPQRQNSESGNPIKKLAEAIAGIASQQQPQTWSALSKPITTSTLMFDGKNEKIDLFEDLFQTILKMQPQKTEAMKVNHFFSHLRRDALHTFRNINASKKRTFEDVLNIFRRKYVRPQSQTTA